MDHPGELILKDVRCFQDEQRGNLRPITLLVGENSTGKTTFLGCYRALHRLLSGRGVDRWGVDFNEEPFLMGSFRDIVRSRRGPDGRIGEFTIGLSIAPPGRHSLADRLLVTFSEEGSQPVVSSADFRFGPESYLKVRQGDNGTIFEVPDHQVESAIRIPRLNLSAPEFEIEFFASPDSDVQPILDYLAAVRKTKTKEKRGKGTDLFDIGRGELSEMIPVAPLRSKPKRTYDPVREVMSPEGEHVPMLMMRLDHSEKGHWASLHDDLVRFGRESGLFMDVKVKRHGRQMSDPFQLQVKVRSGSHANLMDVGYGVSQSLPILVQAMDAKRCTFLLQQPEVHLHPRGQADLASLFVESCRKRKNRFLIETHSDYIVDRIRISVRKGALKPEDVSILYFEPRGNAVTIHNMTLDGAGNLEGAPGGYRDFFLTEADRLLGFGE